MRFYYLSLISLLLVAIFYFGALYVVRQIWKENLKRPFTGVGAWVVVAVVLVAPWSEELWIAYNFGQLCRKDAGIFINKTVEVAGFYDDTAGWGVRQLAESGYAFMESKDVMDRSLSRVERSDDKARDQALRWYAETKSEKKRRLTTIFRTS